MAGGLARCSAGARRGGLRTPGIVPVQTTDVLNVVRIDDLADAVVAAEWQ